MMYTVTRRLYRIAVWAAAIALLVPAAASAAPPNGFVGIVAEDIWAGSPDYRAAVLSQQRAVGIQRIRQTFDWSLIEPAPGQYDFSQYDAYVAAAAEHGIQITPVLFRPPGFRARAAHTSRETYPPRRLADMGGFGAVLASRYGPDGTLWAERPGIPRLPITSYQVWNEPNLPIYWPPKSRAKQYAKMLKKTSRAIKAVDPSAEIITAGLPESKFPGAIPLHRYIKQLYKAGAKRGFDTLAINTYAKNKKQLIKLLRGVRQLMNRKRDRKAKIWASEFGWADGGPRSRFTVSSKRQARNIKRSIRAMGKNRRKLRLSGFVYWNWKDAPPYRDDFDFWGLHAGLLRLDGSRKPAFRAFRTAVKRL